MKVHEIAFSAPSKVLRRSPKPRVRRYHDSGMITKSVTEDNVYQVMNSDGKTKTDLCVKAHGSRS